MSHFTIFLLFLNLSALTRLEEDEILVQKKLSEEERNARCCAKKMNCCKHPPEPTNFEVRALIVKCPKNAREAFQNKNRKGIGVKRQTKCGKGKANLRFDNEDYEVMNCRKKIKLTIKIKNTGMTNCKNQYILIDHVFDAVTEQKQKLLNPYVLKIKQHPIEQLYGLDFQSMVNAQASERVINKKDSGYIGCNVDPTSSHPTCGTVTYNNKIIPYSTGFCCPCENRNPMVKFSDNKNYSGFRIPLDNEDDSSKKTKGSFGVPDVNKNNDNYQFIGGVGKLQGDPSAINLPSVIADNGSFQFANEEGTTDNDKFRHIIQKRGGQDCSDKFTPPGVNPATYHDSTHCLEFSNIWYSVYNLEKPRIFHFLQVQIYEKYQGAENTCKWKELTKKLPIYMSTETQHYTNEQNTIAMNYKSRDVSENSLALNYKLHKLLIPDMNSVDNITRHPEVEGGPEEYLVVKNTEVQANGKECDVAGVGYEAFVKQPERCSVPKGSCLKKQPIQMWKHDHDAECVGELGSYFLRYFGSLSDFPIISNCSVSQNKTLRMYYTECHTSILDVEVKADSNTILRPNSLAIITEVYVDSSSPRKTSILAKVFNSGLVSSVFKVGLTNCPLNLPASFSNINSKPALIPPQRQHIFNLEVECPLPSTSFYCSLQVSNLKDELIAFRNIRLQKLDRCICIWYCSCACLIADGGLKCNPLSLEQYHAAGFQGGLPIPLHVVHYTFLDDMISLMLYIFLFLCLTLLLMGLVKALIGCCVIAVGMWGIDLILDLPKKINKYYEHDISSREVVYDRRGWPIHPDTGRRVRNIALATEFCINIVFFIVYPFAMIWIIIKRLCFSSYTEKRTDSLTSCKCKNGTLVQRKSSSLQNSLVKKSGSVINK